ncbi:MAG: chlorite dismutase family protein [Thermoleophilia bacterium]
MAPPPRGGAHRAQGGGRRAARGLVGAARAPAVLARRHATRRRPDALAADRPVRRLPRAAGRPWGRASAPTWAGYSYLGGTKPSKYFDRDPKRPPRRVVPRRGPYLVVYPMVKIRPWYALPMEERVRAMREHAEVGQRWPTVTNHTTYSFGIDDQEFMPAFE